MVACVANPLEALLGQLSLSDSNNAAAATLGASSLCGQHSAGLPATSSSAGNSMPSFSLQQLQDAQMTLQSQLQSLQLAEALLLSGRGPAAANAPLPPTTSWMPVSMQGPANMLLADAPRTGTRNALAYDIAAAPQYGIPQVGSPPQAAQHRVVGSVVGPANLTAAWPAGVVQATGAVPPGGASSSAAGMPALLSQVLTLFPPPGKQKRSGASRRRKANMYRMLDAAKALASAGPMGVEGAPAQRHAVDGDGAGTASLLSSGPCSSPNGSGLVSGTATPGGSGDLSGSIQTVLLGTQASRPATPPSSAEGAALAGGSSFAAMRSSDEAARTLASMLAAATATPQRPGSPCLSSLSPSLATSRMHGGAVPGAFMSRSKPPSPQASFIVAPPVHAVGGFGTPGAVPAARALSRPPQRSVTMPVVMQRSHMAPPAGPQMMLASGSRMLAPGGGLTLPPHLGGVNMSWQAAGGVPSVERHQTYPLAQQQQQLAQQQQQLAQQQQQLAQQQQQQFFLAAAAAAAAEASSHLGHQQATHMLMQMPYRM